MQSPLTPQRGRIESNPREYTHMGPRHCGELETMPADRRSLAVRPPHERGYLDARAWKIGRSPNESGNSDARRMSEDFRTSIEREWIFGRNLPQKPQKSSKYPLSISDRPKIFARAVTATARRHRRIGNGSAGRLIPAQPRARPSGTA